jgi:hypothetical protein
MGRWVRKNQSLSYHGKYASNSIKQPMDATHNIYYMHDHIKYIINCILIEANIISVPFQTSYLYRFFGSYLRGLVSGFVERCSLDTLDLGNIRCQPW